MTTSKPTAASNAVEIDGIKAEQAEQRSMLQELLDLAKAGKADSTDSKVTPQRGTTQGKASKAAPGLKASKAEAKSVRSLCKSTRDAFVKASKFDYSKGGNRPDGSWGNDEIAEHCLAENYAPAGFQIGNGYRRIYKAELLPE